MYQRVKIGPLNFIHSSLAGFETASLGIFLKVGSRLEKNNQKGIAHFLEHMLFKGSLGYSYKKIKQEIEGRGGHLNGFTSKELTAYYAYFLKKNTLVTLDILLDMVLNPSLLSREVDKERSVVLEEIKMYNDISSSKARTILDELLWQNHPLGSDIAGSEESIKKISRKDLFDFKTNFYNPGNMVISFSGDFPLAKIKTLIEKKIKRRTKRKKIIQRKPAPGKNLRIKVEKKDVQQLHLCLGFRSIAYSSSKRITQQLLNVILGANMSSRLFESLREKRSLCYDISTEIKEFKDSGAFVIRLGLDRKRIKTALAVIKKELEKIRTKEVSKSELIRAKDYFLGQLSMSLEQPQGRMFYLAQSYIRTSKIESFVELKGQVEAISPCKIREFASELFNFKKVSVSAVGDIGSRLDKKIKEALQSK